LALAGWAMNKAILRGKPAAFIMELPLYHLPNWRTIGLTVWQWSVSFVRKAGTVILVASVVIWALSSYPAGDIENSLLGRFGQMLEPVGGLMGLDWRMMLALLSGFVAKENVVATLGVLFGGQVQGVGLTTVLRNALSPAAALAFLVLQMLFIPCVATVGAIRQETNSWRWTAFSVLLLLLISLAGGMVAYNIGRMLGW